MLAVELGFTEAVKVLRNKESRFVRDDGVTALKLAKDTGHSEIIALLSQNQMKKRLIALQRSKICDWICTRLLETSK